ncbi:MULTISPECIES: hypothetical protein [unclassified Rhizobium]|uniref:hypothetical protein n=1 Tax=unclassified Rhizobium TaxID=2613769 RepID=UPI0017831A49|nr:MULTISPECIES: hypothetical protein [unclassified Rhizobium]MBD8687293.1 hypothetical protein [Rhizobium sp. CFBP 13644]MBD8691747.1 hypothetical protein [Rhizobium sp. CFBP 13717]
MFEEKLGDKLPLETESEDKVAVEDAAVQVTCSVTLLWSEGLPSVALMLISACLADPKMTILDDIGVFPFSLLLFKTKLPSTAIDAAALLLIVPLPS